jgi:hypothetical protein
MSADPYSMESLVNEAHEMFRQCESFRAYRTPAPGCPDEYLARLAEETMYINNRPRQNIIVMLCYNKKTNEIRKITSETYHLSDLGPDWVCNTIR